MFAKISLCLNLCADTESRDHSHRVKCILASFGMSEEVNGMLHAILPLFLVIELGSQPRAKMCLVIRNNGD